MSSGCREQRTGYRDGDIVMIKPAGFLWGKEEKTKFLIVKAFLSPQQVKGLMSAKEVTDTDEKGQLIKKILARRRYAIDLKKQGLSDEKALALKGILNTKPVIEAAAVEEKK